MKLPPHWLKQTCFIYFPGEAENVDKLIRRCLLDSFKQTDEDFLKKASSQ